MKFLGKTIFTLCLLAFCNAVFAQLSFGPRAGISLATWSADSDSDLGNLNNRLSLLFGAVAEIRLSDNIAIQPELNFIQKGFNSKETYTEQGGTVTDELDLVMNYLEIPILLKGGVPFGPARFDVLAGPSFGYALNGRFKLSQTFNGDTESESHDIDFKEDDFARTDFSIQFGAAFSFMLGESATLFADARYMLGLTNMNSEPANDLKANNRGVALTVGALFPL